MLWNFFHSIDHIYIETIYEAITSIYQNHKRSSER
jgi:hypothetical protein